jgi:demethylmenaquinone methyltransferase/2-methoxy-6-polyprenyl-1,4-benzoquinol methylase
MSEEHTHFGFQEVPLSEKADRVADVFRKVANQYDTMNDLMSLGSHRLMKRMAVELTRAKKGHTVLDLAGGTGDLSRLLADRVGREGTVILCDINPEMIRVGRDRLLDRGYQSVSFTIGDAEQLPLADQSLDAIIIGFGLRNVTRKEVALKAMRTIWPKLGQWITGDAAPYQYLVESIAMHPDQETLAGMMREAGFVGVGFDNLLGGVAALHYGEAPLPNSPEPATKSME